MRRNLATMIKFVIACFTDVTSSTRGKIEKVAIFMNIALKLGDLLFTNCMDAH